MADTRDLKSRIRKGVRVRLPPSVFKYMKGFTTTGLVVVIAIVCLVLLFTLGVLGFAIYTLVR